jgi:uncharacterized protein (DUF779 family)
MMRCFVTLIFVTFIMICGCGKKSSRPADMPALVNCKIEVKQEGAPISDAIVSIIGVDKSVKFHNASALTDSNGIANIKTYGVEGAPVGKYKVVIKKVEQDKDEKSYDLVQAKYGDEKTTDLAIEVVSEGENVFSLDVGKPVRELVKDTIPPPR